MWNIGTIRVGQGKRDLGKTKYNYWGRKRMQLLSYDDLKEKTHFCLILLINDFGKDKFENLVESINQKKPLLAELCSATFENKDGEEYYYFDTDEGETIYILYDEVQYYKKIALDRYQKNMKK